MNARKRGECSPGACASTRAGTTSSCSPFPRGGALVAYEVAKALGAPLGVFVVRKLGVPGHEELAMGAIASGGLLVLDERLVRSLGIDETQLERAIDTELRELELREAAYGGREQPELRDKTVILVDDGLATGATMRAAALADAGSARAGRRRVPVAAEETCDRFRDLFGQSRAGTRTPSVHASLISGRLALLTPGSGQVTSPSPPRGGADC